MFAWMKNTLHSVFRARPTTSDAIEFDPNNQVVSLDDPFVMVTDTATLAIFDAQVLRHRCHDELDWFFAAPFEQLQEVANRECALVNLGSNGSYRIRVSREGLTPQEQHYNKRAIHAGVKLLSNQCFIGNAESLPGDNYMPTPETVDLNAGGFLSLSPGLYDLDIYPLALPEALHHQFPDIVIVIKSRENTL